jgi:heterodisulfide reductase subunit C
LSAQGQIGSGNNISFEDQVIAETPSEARLKICIQCGTCSGSCPSASDMDHTPRVIFAMIKAGMKDEVLRSNTPWYCVSCYYCMVRCPQDIHITDIMYTLKRMSIKANLFSKSGRDAPEFSETFIDYIKKYGRSFEFGLATRYHLTHHPMDMPNMAPMGLGMLRKGRIALSLTRKPIKGIDNLNRILKKAESLGETP